MLVFLAALCGRWSLFSTLRPENPSSDLFGRSAALCPDTQRIAVGAEWQGTDHEGGIYIFDYDRDKRSWSQTANIRPPSEVKKDNTTILLRSVGSTLFMSTDCKSIIAGAPSTLYRKPNESGVVEDILDVGAVVIFEEGTSGWQMTHVLAPETLESGGGYGRRLAASSDVKYYSAAYFNKDGEGSHENGKVYVSMELSVDEWSSPFLLDVPEGADTSQFGSAIQFVDASSLLVGSGSGVFMYKKTTKDGNLHWYLRRNMSLSTITALNKYTSVGEYVSMPENAQDMVAISAVGSEYDGIVFMKRNDTDNTWRFDYDVQMPKGAVGHLDFCKNRYLATVGTITVNGTEKIAVSLLERDRDGKFKLSENITQPIEDDDVSKHMNFGASFAWDNDHCFRFVVGSMSKTKTEAGEHIAYQYGAAHVYHRSFLSSIPHARQYVVLVAILTSCFGALFVAVIVVVIVYFCLKFKRWRSGRKVAELAQPNAELL